MVGITVPIIPGLKPIYNKKQLTVLPKTFHIDLPADLSNEILKCKTDDEVDELERLRRENLRLKRQLEEKDMVVELLKKVKDFERM